MNATETEIKMALANAAKMVIDAEAKKGSIVCAYSPAENPDHNGVMVAGTLVDLTINVANAIDKIAIQYEVPYQDIIRVVRKIMRDVQRNRRKKTGEPLFERTSITFDNTEEE